MVVVPMVFGDGEDGGEVVGETAGGAGSAFERVGLAGAGRPSHTDVVGFTRDGGDAEGGGAVGRVSADEEFLQVIQAVAVGVRSLEGAEWIKAGIGTLPKAQDGFCNRDISLALRAKFLPRHLKRAGQCRRVLLYYRPYFGEVQK